ncbi:MAG: hypothetical protein WAK13_09330, partial [Terriglobales bacterium]
MNHGRFIFLIVLIGLGLAACALAAFGQDRPLPVAPGDQVRLGNEYLAIKDYSNAMIWFRK